MPANFSFQTICILKSLESLRYLPIWQSVVHEVIALEMLALLLENPTDDSVEVAVGFVKEIGSKLQDVSPQVLIR